MNSPGIAATTRWPGCWPPKSIIELANHTLLISKDGIARPIEDSAAPILTEAGHLNGVVLVFRDFTEKKKNHEEIKYLSFHDHLTGTYNRRFYEEELARLDTERNWPLTIVMGDVNGLKLIKTIPLAMPWGINCWSRLLRRFVTAAGPDDIIARNRRGMSLSCCSRIPRALKPTS